MKPATRIIDFPRDPSLFLPFFSSSPSFLACLLTLGSTENQQLKMGNTKRNNSAHLSPCLSCFWYACMQKAWQSSSNACSIRRRVSGQRSPHVRAGAAAFRSSSDVLAIGYVVDGRGKMQHKRRSQRTPRALAHGKEQKTKVTRFLVLDRSLPPRPLLTRQIQFLLQDSFQETTPSKNPKHLVFMYPLLFNYT